MAVVQIRKYFNILNLKKKKEEMITKILHCPLLHEPYLS